MSKKHDGTGSRGGVREDVGGGRRWCWSGSSGSDSQCESVSCGVRASLTFVILVMVMYAARV